MKTIGELIPISTFRALPKVDLHRHLEGSMRAETLWEFFQRYERPRYAKHEFISAITVEPGSTPGFGPFLHKFNALRFHYGTVENLGRIASEAVEDAALDGVVHLELRFSPVFFARRLLQGKEAEEPVSVSQAENAAVAVMRSARDTALKYGISIEFIATCARHFGLEINRPTLELIKRPIGEAFCGLDLAGIESSDASDFVPAFWEWKGAGKFVTIHAGEDPNGPGPKAIYEALDWFHADRIGHGVRAVEDDALLERLAHEGIPLELCLTSNLQTRAVSGARNNLLQKFLDEGIIATINTDDPSISGTTLSAEYQLAFEQAYWNFYPHFPSIPAWNGARAAFLPEREKSALAARIEPLWKSVISKAIDESR